MTEETKLELINLAGMVIDVIKRGITECQLDDLSRQISKTMSIGSRQFFLSELCTEIPSSLLSQDMEKFRRSATVGLAVAMSLIADYPAKGDDTGYLADLTKFCGSCRKTMSDYGFPVLANNHG